MLLVLHKAVGSLLELLEWDHRWETKQFFQIIVLFVTHEAGKLCKKKKTKKQKNKKKKKKTNEK